MCLRFSNTCRLAFMMVLVALYFLVELIVGYAINSLALVADAFHMLSDMLALGVGIIAVRIAKWPRSSKNTFGWQRADVVGGLINTVVLITLCSKIFMDAIKRLIQPEYIIQKDARVMFGVGIGGLAVNIVGLIVMGTHSHGGEGTTVEVMSESDALLKHSPSSSASPQDTNSVEHGDSRSGNNSDAVPVEANSYLNQTNQQAIDSAEHNMANSQDLHALEIGTKKSKTKSTKSSARKHSHSMNMSAVFLHVLADFFGSIIVVGCALLLWLVPGEPSEGEAHWKVYIDPIMSMLMVVIILCCTARLTAKAALILLQSVPDEICIRHLKERIESIDGVHKVHDLHVWRLQSNCIIGSVHIRSVNLRDYLITARSVKQVFHEFGIHCTTIQPEFEEIGEDQNLSEVDFQTCVLDCGPDKNCPSSTCCPAPANSITGPAGQAPPPGDNPCAPRGLGNSSGLCAIPSVSYVSSQSADRPSERSSSGNGQDSDFRDTPRPADQTVPNSSNPQGHQSIDNRNSNCTSVL